MRLPKLPKLPINPRIYERVERLEIPFNRYGLDEFGVSKEHLGKFYSMLIWTYENYFNTKAFGIQNVPKRGRVMLVGNHSGGVALDAAIVIGSMLVDMEPPRLAQAMADKFMNTLPFVSGWSSRLGHFTGLPEHASRLLEADRMLMVFPEGHLGTAKLYKDRNSLVKFGSGFMRLALETNTPIVPFAFLGGGDAIPTIHNSEFLGKFFGAPYVPFTPYIVPFPRPVDCEIYYGEPMVFEGDGNEDDEVIRERVGLVKEQIRQLIDFGVDRRKSGNLEVPTSLPKVEIK